MEFGNWRCTANRDRKKKKLKSSNSDNSYSIPLSERHCCKACGQGIKQKLIDKAKRNKHKPPTLCFKCICQQKGKKTPRQRKVELAKERKRARDAAKFKT